MGENSGIQWTTHSFNPWVGCQRVSPGCTHCYAEAYDRRVGGAKLPDGTKSLRWGPSAPRVRTSAANWRQPLKWNAAAKAAGERHRVFCSSLADVFEQRAELAPWRADLLDLIRRTPHLDWLLLTKRPENIRGMLASAASLMEHERWMPPDAQLWLRSWLDGHPPANVWLGTTVEDQQRANERIPALLSMPARVRFLSCEPLLERVQLDVLSVGDGQSLNGLTGERDQAGFGGVGRRWQAFPRGVDWVIIGGESGPGARPFALEWAHDLVRQCRKAGVAPFVKQLGACASDEVNGIAGARLKVHPDAAALVSRRLVDPAGGDPAEWPADLRVRESPEVKP